MQKLTTTHTIIIAVTVIFVIIILYKLLTRSKSSSSRKAVLYYINNCQFCQDFKPTWEKLEASKISNMIFISVDCDKYPEIAIKNNVHTFPTIYIDGVPYTGDRSYESLKKYLTN